jgi:hypothetical protein
LALTSSPGRTFRPRTPSPAHPPEQDDRKNPPELSPDSLEFSAETTLTVRTG